MDGGNGLAVGEGNSTGGRRDGGPEGARQGWGEDEGCQHSLCGPGRDVGEHSRRNAAGARFRAGWCRAGNLTRRNAAGTRFRAEWCRAGDLTRRNAAEARFHARWSRAGNLTRRNAAEARFRAEWSRAGDLTRRNAAGAHCPVGSGPRGSAGLWGHPERVYGMAWGHGVRKGCGEEARVVGRAAACRRPASTGADQASATHGTPLGLSCGGPTYEVGGLAGIIELMYW